MTSSHLSLDDETPTGTHLKDNRKERSTSYLEHLVSDWLTKVQVAFDTQKIELLVDLIDDGGYWRDVSVSNDFLSMIKNLPSFFLINKQTHVYVNCTHSRFLPSNSISIRSRKKILNHTSDNIISHFHLLESFLSSIDRIQTFDALAYNPA